MKLDTEHAKTLDTRFRAGQDLSEAELDLLTDFYESTADPVWLKQMKTTMAGMEKDLVKALADAHALGGSGLDNLPSIPEMQDVPEETQILIRRAE